MYRYCIVRASPTEDFVSSPFSWDGAKDCKGPADKGSLSGWTRCHMHAMEEPGHKQRCNGVSYDRASGDHGRTLRPSLAVSAVAAVLDRGEPEAKIDDHAARLTIERIVVNVTRQTSAYIALHSRRTWRHPAVISLHSSRSRGFTPLFTADGGPAHVQYCLNPFRTVCSNGTGTSVTHAPVPPPLTPLSRRDHRARTALYVTDGGLGKAGERPKRAAPHCTVRSACCLSQVLRYVFLFMECHGQSGDVGEG